MTALRIANLDNVQIGKTEAAKCIEAAARAHGGNLGDALRAFGEQVGMSEWTLYAWLRGTRVPRKHALAYVRATLIKPAA